MVDQAKPFSASNYVGQVGPSRRSADAVLPLVFDLLRPTSVIDVGCGAGAWMAACGALGSTDLVGIEGGHPSDEDLQVPREMIETFDLRAPIRLERRFDLGISVEVAEHIPAEHCAAYLDSLAAHTDAVLFSAAVPGQGGTYHVNEQWPDHWAALMSGRGYECFDPWRWQIWQDERVEWWYRQNLVLFARGDAALAARASGFEPGSPRRLVRDELFTRTYEDLTRERGKRGRGVGVLDAVKRRLGG